MDIRRNTFSKMHIKQLFVNVFSQMAFVVTSQRNKWFLSSVLFFGLGCAGYFLFPARIEVVQLLSAVILLSSGFWICRRRALVVFAFQLAASLALGATVSAIHTDLGPSNIPTKTLYSTEVTGTVLMLEPRNGRIRATIKPSRIEGIDRDQIDWNVRLSFLGDSELAIGDHVRASARLFPLRPPSVPDDPDFARNLYFSGIGATGFVFGRQFEILDHEEIRYSNQIWSYIEGVRQSVGVTIRDHLTGDEGGVAKALIIGERGEVTDEIAENLRKSGLAHLLAISGLHMGLLCGTVFFVVRFGLALVPRIALRYPIKKWAAIAAMFSGLVYLGLSGATIPTQRAFVMLLVVWVALLLDRRAISLRLVGVAAIVVLVLRPDAVLGASFQLSFAAVGALVAFYDGPGRRWLDRQGMRPWYERAVFYLLGLLVTGVIVTAVTAPIIGYHFGRISMLGVIANLIAIPVMAFWVMPLIVASLALMPFGLAGIAFALMKPGLSTLIATADLVAAQDWGLWYVSGLDMIAVAGLVMIVSWAVIWQERIMSYLVATLAILVLVVQLNHQEPEILISGDQESWAVYDRHADILHVSSGLNGFQKSLWTGRFGIRPEDAALRIRSCDDPCAITVGSAEDKKKIIIASRMDDPFYFCRNAIIIVNLQNDMPGSSCKMSGGSKIIDDDVLWWQGGVAMTLANQSMNGAAITTVRDVAGDWPWIVIGGRTSR